MARESVARTRRNRMAQAAKTPRHLGEARPHANITQSQSLMNVSELDTRAKATVKDIDELYAALEALVPKKRHHKGGQGSSQQHRALTSGTDTDTAKSSEERDRPRLPRRYNSEKLPKRPWRDDNMNYLAEKPIVETPSVEETLTNERLIASDTEVELGTAEASQEHKNLQRHCSLPTYDEESADETANETMQKKSRFTLFRRHRPAKAGKKKSPSWRSFFSTLSLKRRSKKLAKSKLSHVAPAQHEEKTQTPKQQTRKELTSNVNTLPEERTPAKHTPKLSFDLVDSAKNEEIRRPGPKKIAPPPPTSLTLPEVPQRKDSMETKSDAVQKKLHAWYKYAVRETESVLPKETVRATRSCENLLTDTEIIRKRGTFSSDTDSHSGTDRNRLNKPKARVRKTRARRNRRREERARFHSLPNVKLVTRALNEAEKEPNPAPADATKDDVTTDVTTDVMKASHVGTTTVKPVEAQLSFGSSIEKEEPIADFMKLQKDSNPRNWLARQCSRTTVSCIRPLQLSLFYSESPSREAVHRSRDLLHRPRVAVAPQGSGASPHEFAFKIRRSSSRRRKRRSFKRGQTRLPHQTPFYVPPLSVTSSKIPDKEDSSVAKDSGLGSPDSTIDKRFNTFPVTKRNERLSKLHSESEDSGWASRDRRLANTADTGIQTEPVIVMTAVSTVRRPVVPLANNDNNSQSEV